MSKKTTFLTQHRETILTLDPKVLTEGSMLFAFVVATRTANFLSRRIAKLRKEVDAAFEKPPRAAEPGCATLKLETRLGDVYAPSDEWGLCVVRENRAAEKKVFDMDRVKALCAKKKLNFEKQCMVQPPRPPMPEKKFDESAFKVLVETRTISQKEYESCIVAAPPQPMITVEAPEELDVAIAEELFG